jgi:tetratricopeptide (TPR) repeat protein
MKLKLMTLFLFLGVHVFAQDNDVPRLQIEINESKINYIIKETIKSLDNGVQVSFSAQSDFFGNTNSLKKKVNPASYSEIIKLKKKICNCTEDMNTYLEIGSLFNRIYKPDSARLYLGKALGLCMDEKIKNPTDKKLAYAEANIYMQAGDYASSVAAYEKILAAHPMDTISRVFLTVSYLGLGDTAKFSSITEENYRLMPTELVYTFFHVVEAGYSAVFQNKILEDKNASLKSFTNIDLVKKLPVVNGDSTRIKDCYNALLVFNGYLKFILLSSDSTVTKNDLGFFKIGNENELKSTIDYFNSRIKNKKNKNAFKHHKFVAMAYFLLGDFKSSITSLEKSIATFPKGKGDTGENNTVEQFNNITATYFMLADTNMVIKSLENKIAKKPKIDPDPTDHVILGNFYLLKNNDIKAKYHYEQAIKINEYQTNAYVGLSAIEFKNKRLEEAMIPLNQAYAINPNEPNIYYINAAMYLFNNQPNEAWQIYYQLHTYFPNDEFVKEIIYEYYDF